MSKRKRKQKKKDAIPQTEYLLYTDGGCEFNPGGRGGAAAVIVDVETGEITEHSRGFISTTNNRMEMTAVILGLEQLPERCSVTLYSDSQYVIRTLQGEYSKKKNLDLWKKIDDAIESKAVSYEWVRGHNGNPLNEKCDNLCTQAMCGEKLDVDTGYGVQEVLANRAESQTKSAMNMQIILPEIFEKEKVARLTVLEYAELFKVNECCARAILALPDASSIKFKSYIALKTGGIDFWSRKSKEKILENETEPELLWETITKHCQDEKEALHCLRWHARGVPLYHCIRKILVDCEVRRNCTRRK